MIRPGAPHSLLVANPQPPTRRRILDRLRNGPQTTGKLAAAFPALSRFVIMQHLTVLTHAKLVLIRREASTASTPSPSSTSTTAGFSRMPAPSRGPTPRSSPL